MEASKIVSREEWLAARKALLAREKELTRMRDRLSAERRALPWVKVDKTYVFEGPNGRQTLADLCERRAPLSIDHFRFGPGWTEGCVGCSFLADHIDGPAQHLRHHDVQWFVVSRAPYAEFQAFRKRMGWRFNWVSSHGSDFNYDFRVSFTPEELAKGKVDYNYGLYEGYEELHGTSIFFKDDAGDIFHTYSTYARGDDLLIGAYNFLDLTPKGRNETTLQDWVRHHDRYESAPAQAASCCHSTAELV